MGGDEQALVAQRIKEWAERNGPEKCRRMVQQVGGLRAWCLLVTSPKHARRYKREATWARDNLHIATQLFAGALGLY